MMTATHGGPSNTFKPVALEMGGYVPVSMASPEYASPGDTITISVQIARAHSSDVTLAVSSNAPSMLAYLPAQVVVPAGSTTGSFQATFALSADGGIQFCASNAAGSLYQVVQVVPDSLHRRVHISRL